MNMHVIGSHDLTPNPTPNGRGGSSLAVRQFSAIARGDVARMRPANDFRVGRVFVEDRYCSHCLGIRWMDVVQDDAGVERLAVCWCCGEVLWRC